MSASSKKLIIYLSPYDILRPRTNQVSDVRFCEGFSQNGCAVHLITPFVFREDNIRKEDVNRIYGLEKPYQIHYLPTRFKQDIEGLHRMLLVGLLGFFTAFSILQKNKDCSDRYIISRSVVLLQLFLILKKIAPFFLNNTRIVHWAHDFKKRKSYVRTYQSCDLVLGTNSTLLKDLVEYTGIQRQRTFLTLNPITEAQANQHPDKANAREMLPAHLKEKPLIVYTGKLGIEYNKELIHILEAASALADYNFLFTGGKPEVIKYWQDWCKERKINNTNFTGFIADYSRIIYYQQAADVLVSYYTHQGHHTSYNLPNKICEYMLTGNVIVTPDFGATRDLLNDSNCIFAKPEDSADLARAIRYAIQHREVAAAKARQARSDVQEITFKNRIQKALNFFDHTP
jgi:glycosyltransferase involved in cell wall biosynthesis